jgi:hypothetical protein
MEARGLWRNLRDASWARKRLSDSLKAARNFAESASAFLKRRHFMMMMVQQPIEKAIRIKRTPLATGPECMTRADISIPVSH